MTLRNRVSVAAAVGVLTVVAGVSSVLYFSYAASLHSRVDGNLVDAALQATAIAQRVKESEAGSSGGPPDFGRPVTVGTVQVQLYPGTVTAGQPTQYGPLGSRDVAVASRALPAYFANALDGGRHFRVYTAAMPAALGHGLVRTSRAASADDGPLRTAALLLAALTIAATGITYGAARLTAGRVLRPIADLTAAAEHITQTRDLTTRIESAGTSDEVSRLGSSFDTMLTALHESVTAQRQLVADASHELRTPLTSLTTNLDLLEEGAGLADPQAPALVRAAREQAGELNQLITDLLDLARYHESRAHRGTVRLDLLTDEAVQRVRQRVSHAAIDTELHPCLVHVDPAAVDHAISNLVDNAIKWTPPGAAVRVFVEDGRVAVADHGPGIADEDLPHIFERFYRAPAARGMPGAGLGLAIVARIAQANDATAEVRTGPDGSIFTLTFPPHRSAAEDSPRSQDGRQFTCTPSTDPV
jgi:two-component system sensor histidine kinase MprB